MTLNRVALTVGLVLMDVCWAYPWSALLGTWTDPPRDNGILSAVTILAILLLSAATTYLLGKRMGRARAPALAARCSGTNKEACRKRNPNWIFTWKGGDKGSRW